MINRKETDIENFIEEVERHWRLNLIETEFLDSVFNLMLLKDVREVSDAFNFFFAGEWENLLHRIPENEVKSFAITYLKMLEEEDVEDISLDEFDDSEIQSEYKRRFGLEEEFDIVTTSQLEEMTEKFLKMSVQQRDEILEQWEKN